MKKLSLFVILLVWCASLSFGKVGIRQIVTEGWKLAPTSTVGSDGASISINGYDDDTWTPVELPSTVLNALVREGVYPDPRVGMNNYLIPDVSDAFNDRLGLAKYSHLGDSVNPWSQPWWYRTTTHLPASWKGGKVWLKLDGINYRADVWVNGRQVACAESTVGMFRRFKWDVTNLVKPGMDVTVAVRIHQVDHPGDPQPGTQFVLFGPNRGNAGDIHRDETLKMSGGWDCAPVVRDRNMGIYHPVIFESTGPVTMDDTFVETKLPISGDTTLASVKVMVPLVNNSAKMLKGTLTMTIKSVEEVDLLTHKRRYSNLIKPITISRNVTLNAGDTTFVVLNGEEYPQLNIKNPPLWYPNGYGDQPLQLVTVTFKPVGAMATTLNAEIGLREVTTELMPREWESHQGPMVEHGLVFRVNGRKIFSRGGWLQPDILLDNSKRNIYDQMRLIAELGANTIGSEDMPAPTQDWYDAADRYGLMVWHVFHQCYRMFPGRANQNYPDDHILAAEHVKDEILRYRNHPSVVAWVGVNEVCPSEDLYEATKQAARTLDPRRPFIPTTSTSWDVDSLTPWLAKDMPIGTTDDGAPDYNWAHNEYYFDKIEEVYTQMFKNELGMPAPPVYENLLKFIPSLTKPFNERDRLWPLDSIWAEHGAWCQNNFVFRGFDNAVRTFYSDPTSARDYALKAQLVAADGYRAMLEAANHRAWDITTGVMLWKLNSCWPDVAWQVYDWYLTPNAAYYFSRKAMEPVHAQLNANTETLSVINTTPQATDSLRIKATIHDFSMKKKWEYTDTISVAPNSYKELAKVPKGGKLAAVYLVTLTLSDMNGNEVSHNTYWKYSQHQNFYWLFHLPQGNLTNEVETWLDGKEWIIYVTLKCDNSGCAFFKHLTVSDSDSGESVNPVFWSDNFVTLLPGETRHLTARVASDLLDGKQPVVRIE